MDRVLILLGPELQLKIIVKESSGLYPQLYVGFHCKILSSHFFLLLVAPKACRILVSWPGTEPCSLQWKQSQPLGPARTSHWAISWCSVHCPNCSKGCWITLQEPISLFNWNNIWFEPIFLIPCSIINWISYTLLKHKTKNFFQIDFSWAQEGWILVQGTFETSSTLETSQVE